MQLLEKPILSQAFCPIKDSCKLLQDALRENEKFREIFQFASLEFEKKNREINDLEKLLLDKDSTIKELRQESELLQKRLQEVEGRNNLLNKLLFGKRAEKGDKKEITVREPKKRGAQENHKGHGRKIPLNLPQLEEKVIDLPEDKKSCCGKPFEEIGEEVSYKIGVKKIYYLIKIIRKKYKKTCGCKNPIITAPVEQQLIPKGKFDISFWVNTLIDKYRNHLPIERQIVDMTEYGLIVSPGTIFGGFKKIHTKYIEPLYRAMAEELRKAEHLHADESGWRLFAKVDSNGNYKWFIWVFISKDIVLFVLHPTRSSKVPYKVLFNIDIDEIKKIDKNLLNAKAMKWLNVDKFSSYKALKNTGFVELIYCWSHQRREFIDTGTKYPELSDWVEEWVKRIGMLYHINNERIEYKPEDSLFKTHDNKLRGKIDEIWSLINMEYTHPAQIAIMNSMKEHWKGLTLFIDHPEFPMDNNYAEQIIRAMVLGRKNYWGNHSIWGGELTVAMFSIIQTCNLHGISPKEYLTYYLTECTKRGAAPSGDEIEQFLPHKLAGNIKEKLNINRTQMLEDN
ncbi:MAG: IS66 family transposase [Candidatus Pacearchaeota archaeon]